MTSFISYLRINQCKTNKTLIADLADAKHFTLPKIIGGRNTNITEVPWQLLHIVNGKYLNNTIFIFYPKVFLYSQTLNGLAVL